MFSERKRKGTSLYDVVTYTLPKLHTGKNWYVDFKCYDPQEGLSGNFWLLSFKISYLCLPLFYETRTTPSCHPSGCAYRQL